MSNLVLPALYPDLVCTQNVVSKAFGGATMGGLNPSVAGLKSALSRGVAAAERNLKQVISTQQVTLAPV